MLDKLQTLFLKLDQEKIVYCLMRDSDQLEKVTPRIEIDILVQAQHIKSLCALLAELGFIHLKDWGYDPHHFFIAYEETSNCWIKLDVITEISYGKPIQYLHTFLAEGCLQNRQRSGSIYVLSAEYEMITLVLHCILDKNAFSPARQKRLQVLIHLITDIPVLERLVNACWLPAKNLTGLVDLLENGDWETLLTKRDALIRHISRGNQLGAGTRKITRLFLRKINFLRELFNPRLPSIALLAPDGAGKTTLSAGLQKAFYFPVSILYMGLYQKGGPFSKTIRLPGTGLIRRVFLIWSRYLNGRYHQACRRIVVFDRYIYDALLSMDQYLSPARRLNRWLLSHSCPDPNIVILLDAPGRILYARKQEHSSEYLEKQRWAYQSLKRFLPQMILIDATQDADTVLHQAIMLIWRAIQIRYAADNGAPALRLSELIVEGDKNTHGASVGTEKRPV